MFTDFQADLVRLRIGFPGVAQQNVLRLEVAVNDALLLQCPHRSGCPNQNNANSKPLNQQQRAKCLANTILTELLEKVANCVLAERSFHCCKQ